MTLETMSEALAALEHHFSLQNFAQVLLQGEALLQAPFWQNQSASIGDASESHLFLDSFLNAVITRPSDAVWRQFPEVQVRLWCAQSAHVLKDFERAHRHLDVLTQQYPHPALLYLKGCWYNAEGLTLDALAAFADTLKKDPRYILAYEALITLANTAKLSEQAFTLIQQASQIHMTPRLLEELLVASSQEEFVSMRSLFLELCVNFLSPTNQEMLGLLLKRLYAQEDYYHCTYLGFHLLSYGYWPSGVRNIYVLAALREKQMAQVLQLLLRWPTAAQDALYCLHVGQAFFHWNMPHFAVEIFNQGLAKTPEDMILQQSKREATEACLQKEVSEGSFLKDFLKRMAVDSAFKHMFLTRPQDLLLRYHLTWNPAWERLWKMLQNTVI